MTLDRPIKCAHCKKPIAVNEDFYGVSFGTSSNSSMPMVSIAGVHLNCTYKILDSWVRHRVTQSKLRKEQDVR